MALPHQSRDKFVAAVELFDSRVRVVPAPAWRSPSPCEGWTARDVAAHVVTNLRALATCVGGGDFFSIFGQPVAGEVVSAWNHECHEVQRTLEMVASRSVDTVSVGGNAVPTVAIIDGLMRDLVIHTWDLARSTNGDESLPDDLVGAATAAMAMVTAEARGPGLYGYEVPAPADADPLTRLLALSGRTR